MTLTADYLTEAETRARQFSGAYTGTSGALAADVVRLIGELRERTDTKPQPDGSAPEAVRMLLESIAAVRDRHGKYGPPTEHFARTAALVNAAFGTTFSASDWALVMILDKVSRQLGPASTDDGGIDIAGYAACHQECRVAARTTSASSP